MNNCISGWDLEGFAIDAHGLKSELAYIGAAKYSKLASDLEIASRAGNMILCKEKYYVFADIMKNFSKELKSIFPAEDIKNKPMGDGEFLLQRAKGAADYLKMYEADDALNCLKELDAFTFGEETDALLKHITEKIRNFKYDDALIHLKIISNK